MQRVIVANIVTFNDYRVRTLMTTNTINSKVLLINLNFDDNMRILSLVKMIKT